MKKNHCFILAGLFAFSVLLPSCDVTKDTSIKASADFVNQHEYGNSAEKEDARIGYNVGFYIKSPIGYLFGDNVEPALPNDFGAKVTRQENFVSVGAGLEYISKGAKNSDAGTTTTLHLNYLEVPLTAAYNHELGNGDLVFGGLGPYFAYGIGGKIKSGSFHESSFGENDGGYKRFDAGLVFMAGYKMSMGLSADLTYDFGLVNIAYASTDIGSKNRALSLNIGYPLDKIFGNMKKK